MRKMFPCLAAMGLAVACSTSQPTFPDSGVPDRPAIDTGDIEAGTARSLVDLSLRERKILCDWSAKITGGYGHIWSCEAGLVVNHESQDTCLKQYLANCYSVFVEQWIACQKKIASDPCGLFLYTAPECRPVLKCQGQIDGGPPPPPDMDAGDDGGDQ